MKKIILSLTLVGLIFSSTGVVLAGGYGYGPTVPPKQTTAGKLYGPYHTWIKGSDLAWHHSIGSKAKSKVIAKYGKINKNKSYKIKWYNEIQPAGWGLSSKGVIKNVSVVGIK